MTSLKCIDSWTRVLERQSSIFFMVSVLQLFCRSVVDCIPSFLEVNVAQRLIAGPPAALSIVCATVTVSV